jgi:hypothetical protein
LHKQEGTDQLRVPVSKARPGCQQLNFVSVIPEISLLSVGIRGPTLLADTCIGRARGFGWFRVASWIVSVFLDKENDLAARHTDNKTRKRTLMPPIDFLRQSAENESTV